MARCTAAARRGPDELLPLLRRLLQPGDVVFIKASRSVGLENFAATLTEDGPAPESFRKS